MRGHPPKKCPACKGDGEKPYPYNSLSELKYYKCYDCDGSGAHADRWTSDYKSARYLSNNDNESEPVCISNMRVWKEQDEHWENYGRGDFRSYVEDMLNQAVEECPINDGQLDGHKHFGWSDLLPMDELYYELCETAEFYPERIDSSAWNFGLEVPRPERTYNHRSHIWQLLQEQPWLIYRKEGPQTLQDFIIEHQGKELPDDVLVSIDRALERGEVDQHIAEQTLGKPNSPAKESSP